MMIRKLVAPLALVVLAACDGNPFGEGGGGGPDPDNPIPAQLAGSLQSASYSTANGGTLQITLEPFDEPEVTATFVRAPALDVDGYEAFVPNSSAALDRNYVAFRAVQGGAVAVAVGDGGRGVDAFGGTVFGRSGLFNKPTTGLAVYRGSYAGVRVQGDGSVAAQDAHRVSGDVEINADFDDNQVEGSISNRLNIDTATALEDRFLKVTAIDGNGRFQGDVTDPADNDEGTYAGNFADNGASVAGTVAIDDGASDGYQDDVLEYGVFALPCVDDDPNGTICP